MAAENSTARKTEHNRKWRQKNREKVAAHVKVNNAIRSGRLAKKPCSKCGHENAHAHHEDYSRPLDVTWLCALCHKARHAELDGNQDGTKQKPYSETAEYHRNRRRKFREANPLPPSRKKMLSEQACEMRSGGMSFSEIAKHFGITKGTAYKWVMRPAYK